MLHLPHPILPTLQPFRAFFCAKTWERGQLLLVGAMLAPGQRTGASTLRIAGLHHKPQFQRYHRVLNRAQWSSRPKGAKNASKALQSLFSTPHLLRFSWQSRHAA